MRAAFAICLLLLAGCGDGYGISNQGPDENQIQRLATPVKHEVDTLAPARPHPLTRPDLAAAGLGAPACDFSSDGRMLLAVSAEDALARIGGTLLHFAHAAPVGPTGGFLEDRQISISVGRVGEVAPGESATGAWPARLTVTNRRAEAQVELAGIWRCG